MKVKTITLKGFANVTNYISCENTTNKSFIDNYNKLKERLINEGYKKLQSWENLYGKKATEKIIVKGWYWRGAWSDPTKETYSIFYK